MTPERITEIQAALDAEGRVVDNLGLELEIIGPALSPEEYIGRSAELSQRAFALQRRRAALAILGTLGG